MPFEYNIVTYTLHLIGLDSVRYGKTVLTFSWSRKEENMGDQIHVTLKNGSWVVKQPENQRASKICNTQAEAREVARGIAKNQGLEMIVHGVDGKIREKNTYRKDPFPPRG